MSKNIILIGMRGSGKTTVSKILSQKLDVKAIDTDFEIEKQEKKKITIITAKFGWNYFRNLETKFLQGLDTNVRFILSAGGGIILKEKNRKLLKNLGKIFYLYTKPESSYQRIGNDKNRPLLTQEINMLNDLKKLFEERKEIYEKMADYIIDTEKLNANEVAENIMKINTMQTINSNTQLFCIFGHPVHHSLSPLMHNFAFEKLNLNDIYLAFDVLDIQKATDSMRCFNIKGASITVPHKIELLKYLDQIDPLVQQIGACNTIINNDDRLTGYNTDWYGAITPLKQIFGQQLQDQTVVLLGAGGAARGVAFGLAHEKIKFVILNRTIEKAEKLAKESHANNFGGLYDFKKYQNCSIIINSTSVGLENHDEEKTAIDTQSINKNHVVFDIVYKPKMTKLLKEAKKNGAKIIYGYKMLLYQAELQFKLFTGLDFPTLEVEKLLVKNLFYA